MTVSMTMLFVREWEKIIGVAMLLNSGVSVIGWGCKYADAFQEKLYAENGFEDEKQICPGFSKKTLDGSLHRNSST